MAGGPHGEEEEEKEQGHTWHQVERKGSRFRCTICGLTRNTNFGRCFEIKIYKHMQIHDEVTDDGTYTCRHCPYQNNSEDQLKQHIDRTHINRNLNDPARHIPDTYI